MRYLLQKIPHTHRFEPAEGLSPVRPATKLLSKIFFLIQLQTTLLAKSKKGKPPSYAQKLPLLRYVKRYDLLEIA